MGKFKKIVQQPTRPLVRMRPLKPKKDKPSKKKQKRDKDLAVFTPIPAVRQEIQDADGFCVLVRK